MSAEKEFSTVYLDPDKCRGCVNCMKRCPTDAIRVRNGKASVQYSRCIGCGECIRICPHGAKQASYDPFDTTAGFKHKIALVPPSFYGQFGGVKDINKIISALLHIGFTDVFEVGMGAELVTDASMKLLDEKSVPTPVISTACPAVVELIYDRFGSLVPNLLHVLTPVDITAKLACEKYEAMGCEREEYGIFFISPCPAKVYALKSEMCVEGHNIDGVLAVSDVYKRVQPLLKGIENPEIKTSIGVVGLEWAGIGGEAAGVLRDDYLAADGIENVIKVLNSIEDGKLGGIEFIELNACVGGCVGGVLNVENPFVAKARLRELRKTVPYKVNYFERAGKPMDFYLWERNPEKSIKQIDRRQALSKMVEYDQILKSLPGINCGICGAPSCSAFAYDIASGIVPRGSVCPVKNHDS